MLKRMLSTEANDHIVGLENTMQAVVESWKNSAPTNAGGQIHSIYAPPGGGKTWLLTRWKARWGGILLDLASESRSPAEYSRTMKAQLQNAPEKRILYLDNVPGKEDELTRAFQEEILEAELNAHSLVIQAQTHPQQTCWGGKIPHISPGIIPFLSLEGAETVRRKFKIVSALNGTENILFSRGTLPGLVQAWCEGLSQKIADKDILRNYLEAWWQRSGEAVPDNFSSHLMRLAVLACQNTFDAKSMLSALSELQNKTLQAKGIQFTENRMPFQLKMKRLGWMQPDGGWFPPIASVLQAWLSLHQPHVYACLTENQKETK